MSKVGARAMKVETPTVGLQTVSPLIPRNLVKLEQLKADLKKMGCEGLIA